MATTAKSSAKSHRAGQTARWSQHVTETSDAMDLKPDVFTQTDPKAIARSVKSSAEHSDRRKSDPYRSAMSMITFYINRAGHNLTAAQHMRLETAKDELRALFGKPARTADKANGTTSRKAVSRKPARKTVAKRATGR